MAVGWIGLAYSNSLATMIAFHSIPGGMARMYYFINRKIEVAMFAVFYFTFWFGLQQVEHKYISQTYDILFHHSLHVKKKIQSD